MIGGWRWLPKARRRHYFQGRKGDTVRSLCGDYFDMLTGMEKQVPGPDDCQACTRKLAEEDGALFPLPEASQR